MLLYQCPVHAHTNVLPVQLQDLSAISVHFSASRDDGNSFTVLLQQLSSDNL